MDFLEPKPLYEVPNYYRNPTGVGTFTNMGNGVRKGRTELILTTEYVDFDTVTSDFTGYTITFKKLKTDYTITNVSYGVGGYGIAGVYIKGVINWSNGTQSAFSTINNIFYSGRTLTLLVSAEGRIPVSAKLRISQLA